MRKWRVIGLGTKERYIGVGRSKNLELVDGKNEKVGVKVDMKELEGIGKELEKISEEVRSSRSSEDGLEGNKLIGGVMFTGGLIGVGYGVGERLIGVEVGSEVLAVGRIVFDKKDNKLTFTFLEGLFKSKELMLESIKPDIFIYQISILVFGMMSGYCLLNSLTSLFAPRKKD